MHEWSAATIPQKIHIFVGDDIASYLDAHIHELWFVHAIVQQTPWLMYSINHQKKSPSTQGTSTVCGTYRCNKRGQKTTLYISTMKKECTQGRQMHKCSQIFGKTCLKAVFTSECLVPRSLYPKILWATAQFSVKPKKSKIIECRWRSVIPYDLGHALRSPWSVSNNPLGLLLE